jgi:hypothetical protein
MTLRLSLTICFLLLIAGGCADTRNDAAPSTRPTLASLNEHPVIGELGVPLGTIVEIRAIVIAGHKWGTKADDGKYLLRVTELDGRPLIPTPYMHFFVHGVASVNLANDDFALYELKKGQKAHQLDSKQIAELEKGYVGKQVRLVVYEAGEYSGMPRNLPPEIGMWQDHGFVFSTYLGVLAERP